MTEPTSPVPGPRPALAGLAAELAVLRAEVDALAGLPGQVRDLAGVLAALADRPAPNSGPEAALASWLDLSADFADAVTILGELVDWLGTVYLRYPDAASGLPECWLWHPDVVEELLWLRAAWLEAYRNEATGAAAAAAVARAGDWHDRQRPGVARRIRAVAGTCSLEAHQPRGECHRGARPVPLAEAIHTIGEWWANDRQNIAPAPDDGHIAAAAALRVPRRRR